MDLTQVGGKNLIIRKSTIPKAGKGLFTRVAIAKGQRIVEYKGRLQLWNEVKHEDGYNGYLLRINRSLAVNAEPYKKASGRYANDASGISKVSGLRNNAAYHVYGTRCFIEAIRAIAAGEEILVSYGKEYWDLIRKIQMKSE